MSDRDFDEEKVYQKMVELRQKVDLEFLNQDMENINSSGDYQKHVSNSRVMNVKYLGKAQSKNEIDGEIIYTDKDIYLVECQIEKEDGSVIECERYYTEDGELVAGNNKDDQFDYIIATKEFQNQEELLKKLQELDKEGEFDLNKVENEKLEKIAKALGIKKEDLDKVSELEIEELEESKEDTDKAISENELGKISTKTEMKADERVTDNKTVEEMLGVQSKGYEKIAVVFSEKLQDGKEATKFSFVGIKADGSAEKIEGLERDNDKNTNQKLNVLNEDGSKIEEKPVESAYTIGTNSMTKDKEQLVVTYGPYGTLEVSYARTPNESNKESLGIPVETNNIRPTTREVQEFGNRQRNPEISDEIERINKQQELGNENPNKNQIDDDKYNDDDKSGFYYDESVENFEPDSEYVEKFAREIMDNSDGIREVYNFNDVKKMLEKKLKENPTITKEEMASKIEENAEKEVLPGKDRR